MVKKTRLITGFDAALVVIGWVCSIAAFFVPEIEQKILLTAIARVLP